MYACMHVLMNVCGQVPRAMYLERYEQKATPIVVDLGAHVIVRAPLRAMLDRAGA